MGFTYKVDQIIETCEAQLLLVTKISLKTVLNCCSMSALNWSKLDYADEEL